MPIYITPLSQQNHFLNINPNTHVELFEVYYKTIEGPLGFCKDEKSGIIFRRIVEDSIWYSESKDDFEIMNNFFLNSNPMYHFNGLFIMPDKYIEEEIAIEKGLRLTIIKNRSLKKYNKPLLKETKSFFTEIYNKSDKKYTSLKIEELLAKGIDIAIGHSDSLGSHFIMSQESLFMNRLISSCSELDVAVNRVDGDRYIPAW